MIDAPRPADISANLREPTPGHQRALGDVNARARGDRAELSAGTQRAWIGAATAAAAGVTRVALRTRH